MAPTSKPSTANVDIIDVDGKNYYAYRIPAAHKEQGSVTVQTILQAAHGQQITQNNGSWRTKLAEHNKVAGKVTNDGAKEIKIIKAKNCDQALQDARIYAGDLFILGAVSDGVPSGVNQDTMTLNVVRVPNSKQCLNTAPVPSGDVLDKQPKSTPLAFSTPKPTDSLDITFASNRTSLENLPLRVLVPLTKTPSGTVVNPLSGVSLAQTPYLLGAPMGKADIAAPYANSNLTGAQTWGDVAGNIATNAGLAASIILQNGASVVFVPTQVHYTPQQHNQISYAGGNGGGSNLNLPTANGGLDLSKQWPFTGQWNPFAPSDRDMVDKTRLPLGGVQMDKTGGSLIHAPNTQFPANWVQEGGSGVPHTTINQSALEGRRESGFGSAATPVPLGITSSMAQSVVVNEMAITPALKKAHQEYAAFVQDKTPEQIAQEKEAFQALTQKLVGLYNLQGDLECFSYQSISPLLKARVDPYTPLSLAERQTLNNAEQIAYNRDLFIAGAKTYGIEVDENYSLPTNESPIRSIPKAQLRSNMTAFFVDMAHDNFGAFQQYAQSKEYGAQPQLDRSILQDREKLRALAEKMVNETAMIKTYPDRGQYLADLAGFVLKPRDKYNPFEKGELSAQQTAKDPAKAIAEGMELIASDPALTKLMVGATPRTFAIYDQYVVNNPLAAQGKDNLSDMELTRAPAALKHVKDRGYTPEMQTKTLGVTTAADGTVTVAPGQSILRGNLAQIDQAVRDGLNNASIVALRQEDLKGMVKAGHPNDPNHQPGHLAVRALYAIAGEADNTTWKAMETVLKNNSAHDAQTKIEILRQAAKAAADIGSVERIGLTPDQLAVGAVASVILRNEPPVVTQNTEFVQDSRRAQKMLDHLAQHPEGASAFLGSLGKSTGNDLANGAQEDVLAAAKNLPTAEKTAIANAMLAQWPKEKQNNLSAAIYRKLSEQQSPKLSDAEIAQTMSNVQSVVDFRNIPAKKAGKQQGLQPDQLVDLLFDGATGIDNEKTALEAIAKNGPASQILVGALNGNQPGLIKAFEALTTAERNNVASSAAIDQRALTHPTGDHITTTRTQTLMLPEQYEAIHEAAKGTGGQIAALKKAFSDTAVGPVAFAGLATQQPAYAAAIALDTLRTMDTNHQKAILNTLHGGEKSFFSSLFKKATPQDQLADLMQAALEAKGRTAQMAAAEALNAFTAANPTAVGSLLQAMQNNPTVKGTLLTTLSTNIDNPNVLPQADLINALTQVIPNTLTAGAAAGTALVNRSSTTTTPVLPGVPLPGGSGHQQSTTPSCTVNCSPINPPPFISLG